MRGSSLAALAALALTGCAATAPPPSSASAPTPAPAPAPTRLAVIPSRVLLEQGQSLRFRAVGDGPEEPAVEWSVVQGDGGPLTYDAGSITAEGVYTPGIVGHWNYVQAISKSDPRLKAMAQIQIVPRRTLPVRDESSERAPTSDASTSTFDMKGRRCLVRAPGDFREDAERIAKWTDDAVDALSHEFAADLPPEMWDRHRITVVILDRQEGMEPGQAQITTAWDEEVCRATVRFLAPSLHGSIGSTLAGLPFEEAYFRATLVHELASVALEAVTRSKGVGWGIYDAPSWFVQGLEEWLAITLGPREAGDITRARYRRMVLSNPDEIIQDWHSLRVRNPYVGGTTFVGFLHEEFGKEKVRALLRSPEKDFQAAFVTAFGASPGDLTIRFCAWLYH